MMVQCGNLQDQYCLCTGVDILGEMLVSLCLIPHEPVTKQYFPLEAIILVLDKNRGIVILNISYCLSNIEGA